VTELAPEQAFAHYLLLERIGSGVLGDSFRARDTRAGRTCLLKILPADFAPREPLLEAARQASTLTHPAMAMLFDFGEADGRPYLAYEFVQGETLRQALEGGPMHPRRAVPIAIQVADALAEAHAAGIVHRDLNPDTIMLTPKGTAKVLEVGISEWTVRGRARTAATTGARIEPGLVASTVGYMSPEQVLAQPADGRSDLFSLGIILYEMLTGRNPFAGADADTTIMNLLRARPQPPSSRSPDIPGALDAIVMRLLARDVQSRYESPAGVASELRAAFGERTEHIFEAEDEHPSEFAAAGARRGRGTLWVALVVLLVVAAAAALAYPRLDAIRGWARHLFGPPPAAVIAVIPFAEQGQPDTAFADGLAEDLAMRLGETPGLTVVGRSAVRSFRGREVSDVARQTNAAVVLTGTIQRPGGDLKLDLRLVDASDGAQVWQQEFTNAPNSIIAGQAVVAEEVAKALGVPGTPAPSRERMLSRSISPDAYDTYTRARAALSRREYDRAIQLFESAAKQDEGLAEALAGLAIAQYRRAISSGQGMSPEVQAQVRDAVTRAAATEPDLAMVEMAAGVVAPNLRESLNHLVRAARIDPSYAAPYGAIADLIAPLDSTRAGALNARARRLDPQAPPERMFETAASAELRKELESDRARVRALVEEALGGLPQ
jgi:serine/threonine-protein kinase